jgi:iron complex outermembrane receptor protein
LRFFVFSAHGLITFFYPKILFVFMFFLKKTPPYLLVLLWLLPHILWGQIEPKEPVQPIDTPTHHQRCDMFPIYQALPEVFVGADRVGQRSPVAFTNLTQAQLAPNNLGVDLPILLDQTPSVVTTSDAGHGIGYTGLRIRGSDGTRINVTVNGVPLNDSESQQVFWVNMPDFASGVDDIQIQRGVGTSVNGAGAFGASVNLRTMERSTVPYMSTAHSVGSFGTHRHNLRFGTGLIRGHWHAEGRLSYLASEGYVDRSAARLRSFYAQAGYEDDRGYLRAVVFGGQETTRQAWYGTPRARLENDSVGMADYAAFMGLSADQTQNLFDSDRRYNYYTYDNQVDDYAQTHYQLHGCLYERNKVSANVSLHYTRGRGYFEEFRAGDDLADYGLPSVTIGDSTIEQTDLIRRRWLDNHFFGATYSVRYTPNHRTELMVGGGWNHYLGDHFGEVIWARFASTGEIRHRYYLNDASKTDGNTFVKFSWSPGEKRLNLFVDLQHRFVRYAFQGPDQDGTILDQSAALHFFNPKAGLRYTFDSGHSLSLYGGIAHREPNRNDFVDAPPAQRPTSERLYDVELGWRRQRGPLQLEATAFGMFYRNELVLTGRLNDVGAYTRVNVPQSRRLGLELSAAWRPKKMGLLLQGNAAFSDNRIVSFTEFVDDWDTGGQVPIERENTPLAFSPAVVAGGEISFDWLRNAWWQVGPEHQSLNLAFVGKYVGKQYLDNTGDDSRALSPWFTADLRLHYALLPQSGTNIRLTFTCRNLFDNLFAANGWVYRFRYDGAFRQVDGLFPQAGRHWMAGVEIGF